MRVLIIDDEPLVRKSLGRAFLARGHQVSDAVDGREGLERWLGLPVDQRPDLVMLDVLMPGLSGPEVLREIFAKTGQRPAATVILMSAYSGEHNLETARQMGADLFIPKPFDDVFAVVKRAEELQGKE